MKPDRILRRAPGIASAVILWLCLALGGFAAELPKVPWDQWDKDATNAREMIAGGDIASTTLDELRTAFDRQRAEAQAVSVAASEEVKRLEAEVAALGPAPEEGQTEAPETAAIRADLGGQLEAMRATLVQADRAATRARDLVADLAALGQKRFLQRLTTLSSSPLTPENWSAAIAYVGEVASQARGEVSMMLQTPSLREKAIARLPFALLVVMLALFVAFGVRGFALALLTRRAEGGARRRSRLLLGVGATAVRIVALVVAVSLLLYGVGAVDLLGTVGQQIVTGIAVALIYLIGAYATAAALFSPHTARLRLSSMTDLDARLAFSFMMVLGAVLGGHDMQALLAEVVPQPQEASAVFSFLLISVGSLALWSVARVIRHELVDNSARGDTPISAQIAGVLRRMAIAVALAAPVLSLVGYEFAAQFLFFSSVLSLGLIAVAFLIFAVTREGVEIYLADTGDAQAPAEGERLRLIPIFIGFVLICGLIPLLALTWGASWTDLAVSYEAIASGFVIGDVAISPVDFFWFLLIFLFGYSLTRLAQRTLRNSVFPKAGMTRGGADALASGIGYIGVLLAAVAAISAVGLDLSNLAIVAGALSVGIGFGLQNIVNNFVSGIILLVERPIRVGDWIEVGGVAGYVEKVNVRSTEIRTFDRASYILPNSDLISGAVLNWTHADTTGRVIVKVGVAYGSDTRQVERILLGIAADHPMIIASPPPQALFMSFGSDALEFELRAFLRDINWMLSVRSDLNFSIAEQFAAAGIEIPFAQREVTIKNPEALATALRARPVATGGANDA